jgi:hypothetical protein
LALGQKQRLRLHRGDVGLSRMKPKDFDAWADAIIDTLKKAIAPLQRRLQSLEAENVQLRNRVLSLEAIEAARDEVRHVDQ